MDDRSWKSYYFSQEGYHTRTGNLQSPNLLCPDQRMSTAEL